MYTVNELLSIHTIYFDNKNNENIFKKIKVNAGISKPKKHMKTIGMVP